MSADQKDSVKKRKRTSKAHESHTPSRKRSKQDLVDESPSATPSSALQNASNRENVENGVGALDLIPAATGNWNISAPVGGRFLNAPPVFSQDEKFLLLAAPQAIHVYDCSTSLLVRKLSLPEDDTSIISSYVLSSSSPNHVYAGTKTGLIYLWDWTAGQKIGQWKVDGRICALATGFLNQQSRDILYTHEVSSNEESTAIKAYELNEPSSEDDNSTFSSAILFSHKGKVGSFQVHLDGKVAVVSLENSILVGERHSMEKWALNDLVYTWRELELTSAVSCFDVRIRILNEAWKHDFSHRDAPKVDIAIGRKHGEITVYEDILTKLIHFETFPTAPEDRLSTELHWHRRPVGSVRWSLDGNYLISGGGEMTLVLWQMSTGKRNTLPYLMAAITQIVVSPNGASYAIQLADNSTIVLSTTELEAKTSIAGIQTHFLDPELFQEKVSGKRGDAWRELPTYLATPATIDPLRPTELLAAVPSSFVKTAKEPAAPYLQRFDISTSRHVYRQALTRNNATHVNESPEGDLLWEPNVSHLQVSYDGKWMATIEDWTPPMNDLEHVDFGPESIMQERDSRREVYIKFWRRNEANQTWALDTRIDSPHLRPDGTPSRIFSLVAEPTRTGFATVGDDGYLKIWKPKTRLHDGRFVRGARARKHGVVIWSARHSVCLEQAVEKLDMDVESWTQYASSFACMAFSTDGSVLAVSQELPEGQTQGVVHLIDTATGVIQRSVTGLWDARLAAMAFVDRYLIIASDSLHVWDLVLEKLVYSFLLGGGILTRWPRLAVNGADETFALAIPIDTEEGSTSLKSRVLVFKPTSPEPLSSTVISNVVVALLPARASPGYIVLDSAAEIRTLTPKSSVAIPLITQLAAADGDLTATAEIEAVTDAEESAEEEEEEEEEDQEEMEVDGDVEMNGTADVMEDEENDRPIVRPDQLAEVFDVGPSFALPPVQDLFNSVVGLYARKTRVQPEVMETEV